METQPAIKRSLLKELIALLLFVLIGGMFTIPILTYNGEVAARSKTAFFVLIFCRLAWQIHKRAFRFRDYLIYFVLLIGFSLWLDSYAGE